MNERTSAGVIKTLRSAAHALRAAAESIASSLPRQMLPIVRGKNKKVVFLRSEADKVEDWAVTLPGRYDGSDNPTPLIVRDAVPNDILS